MISIQHLVENVELYEAELQKRFKPAGTALLAKQSYQTWKELQSSLDVLRQEKNAFNETVIKLSGDEKATAIAQMKEVSDKIKDLESQVKTSRDEIEKLISQIPNLTWEGMPLGKDDSENPVKQIWGTPTSFDFTPKPYWELEVYKKYVSQEDGVKAMGSRGYYLRGEMSRFRKVLFDWAEDKILQKGFEMFYTPLMLNEKIMTDIGNLPDFDGQLYEVKLENDKMFYLIPSSEQSMMGYWAGKDLGSLEKPLLITANTTCFRKEAGSYGKDQQGILRVHQFEKIEMDAIYRPQDEEKVFNLMSSICEDLYTDLGIHFRAVEICSGDMPHKHYRQVDYEAWFPAVEKFREIASNGSATDFQNRGLKISYQKNEMPWSNNCTGMVFRTGLAILEQFQNADGSVRVPKVLQERFGKEILE